MDPSTLTLGVAVGVSAGVTAEALLLAGAKLSDCAAFAQLLEDRRSLTRDDVVCGSGAPSDGPTVPCGVAGTTERSRY